MHHQKTDGKATQNLRTTCRRLLQGHSLCNLLEHHQAKFRERYIFFRGFSISLTEKSDFLSDANADVRPLAFLSHLTVVLHVSPFYSCLKCKMAIGAGTYHATILIHTTGTIPYNLKSDFHGDMSMLHEWTVAQCIVFDEGGPTTPSSIASSPSTMQHLCSSLPDHLPLPLHSHHHYY